MAENIMPLLKRCAIDIATFEKENDLTQETFLHTAEKRGKFNISNGTEYEWHLEMNLSIAKIKKD